MTQLLTRVDVPADVPSSLQSQYEQNFQTMTKGTGRLMLFAGDQKVEHLNDDFYGTLSNGEAIAEDDADPEHLFKIARDGVIGCFATQLGLIARYGARLRNRAVPREAQLEVAPDQDVAAGPAQPRLGDRRRRADAAR